MKTLFFLVNSVCDIACTYCFYTTGYEKRSKNRIHPETADYVSERITSVGFNTVILTGGDPLHSRFKHETYVLICALKTKECKVIVNTSAALLTDDDFDTIVKLGVDRVDVSIDSHDAGIHDSQRGRHADAVRTITGLINRGYHSIATTTVVTPANASTLPETVAWLRSLGVKNIRIQRAFLPGKTSSEDDVMCEDMRKCVSQLSDAHVRAYIELTERVFRNETPLSGPTCQMGKEYFVCDATGVLTPCFHRFDLVLGNLFSDPIDAIRRSLERNELTAYTMPPCFGKHCVSLFDNPKFWR